MKNLLNLGVSDPLTLGMAHPIADRLETLGRARPTTWRTRSLALSAMGVITLASAPITAAESVAKWDADLGNVITVIPDMTDTKFADLKSRMDKLSTGQADRETLTEFMMVKIDRFVVRYDDEDKLIDVKSSIPVSNLKEVMETMPRWLKHCKSKEKADRFTIERTRFSWGSASVQCTVTPLPKPRAAAEAQ